MRKFSSSQNIRFLRPIARVLHYLNFQHINESIQLIRPRICARSLVVYLAIRANLLHSASFPSHALWVTRPLSNHTALIFCYAPWYLPLTAMQPSSSSFLCTAKESLSCNPPWTPLSWYISAWAPHNSALRSTIIVAQDTGHQAPKNLQISSEDSIVISSALWLDTWEFLYPLSSKRRF